MTDYMKVNGKALPALTSRFLLLLEDGEDFLGLKPKPRVRKPRKPVITKIEETKEPEEIPMMVSPQLTSKNNKNKNEEGGGNISEISPPVWSSLPAFDSTPAHMDCMGLTSISARPLPDPSTPCPTKNEVSLFASFSASPISGEASNMWQYNTDSKGRYKHQSKLYRPLMSPLTTDAVGEDHTKNAAEALWLSPNQNNLGGSDQYKSPAISNTLPPFPPSLMIDDLTERHKDGLPSTVIFRIREPYVGGSFHNDDDEVSLLADDPDEDDEGVLPPSTYDVVVNILDEIDRDGNEIGMIDSKSG